MVDDIVRQLQKPKLKGTLFLIQGPYGVGKTTLIERIVAGANGQVVRVVPDTTRSKRIKEVDNVDYRFISKEEYHAAVAQNDYLVTLELQAAFYGVKLASLSGIELGQSMVMDAHPDTAAKVKANLGTRINIITIFLTAELATLRERMMLRGDHTDSVEKRMALNTGYLPRAAEADFQLTNDNLDESEAALTSIVKSFHPNFGQPANFFNQVVVASPVLGDVVEKRDGFKLN